MSIDWFWNNLVDNSEYLTYRVVEIKINNNINVWTNKEIQKFNMT